MSGMYYRCLMNTVDGDFGAVSKNGTTSNETFHDIYCYAADTVTSQIEQCTTDAFVDEDRLKDAVDAMVCGLDHPESILEEVKHWRDYDKDIVRRYVNGIPSGGVSLGDAFISQLDAEDMAPTSRKRPSLWEFSWACRSLDGIFGYASDRCVLNEYGEAVTACDARGYAELLKRVKMCPENWVAFDVYYPDN